MKVHVIRTKHSVAYMSIYSNLAMQHFEQRGPAHADGAKLSYKERGYELLTIQHEEAFDIINKSVEVHNFGALRENRLIAQDIAKFKEDGYIAFGGSIDARSSNVSTADVRAAEKAS